MAALAVLATTVWASDAMTGVDVSRYQHTRTLNWSAVKADGIDFAFIKATEGRTYTNPHFRADWAATGRRHIFHGAYHFARPSKGTARAQARYFVSRAGRAHGRGVLPPVLDLETTGGLRVRALRHWTAAWLTTVHRMTGRTPIIYVSPYFWRSYLGNSQAFHRYPLWVAHYGVRHPDVPGGWPRWTFWQKSSSGRVRGIAGNVDIDVFHGTRRRLARMAHASVRRQPAGTSRPRGAGAPTAPGPTQLSFQAASRTVYVGDDATFTGTLARRTGAGLGNKPVVLYRQLGSTGSWARTGTATTGAHGGFRFSVPVKEDASYKAVFGGGKAFATSTSRVVPISVFTTPRTDTSLDVNGSRPVVRRGHPVRLWGKLTTKDGYSLGGRRVHVYKRRGPSAQWTQVAKPTTYQEGGWWLTTLHPRRSFAYKAVWPGGTRFAPSQSKLLRVVVRH
jgi:GH25 family lysozyme M1 (1,4-beta-N-acetylmuramidase)